MYGAAASPDYDRRNAVMATFLKRLDGLLEAAREKGVVDANTSEALRAYAGEREKGHGVLSLAAVLGWLGSGVAGLGVILLISANWEEISDFAKLAGVVLLLAATHGTGLWIRLTDRPAQKTAEALNFLGAWVFLGGIALVAQIYNLNDHPPNGILLWLIGIVVLIGGSTPTAFCHATWMRICEAALSALSEFYVFSRLLGC